MKSSAELLLNSLEPLVESQKINEDNSIDTILGEIGKILENHNKSLYYKWMEVRDFYRDINESIDDNLTELYKSITIYSKNELAQEENLEQAINYANDMAENILKDLEI